MARPRRLAFLLAAIAAAIVVVRHGRGSVTGRGTPGGILIADAAVYDTFSRLLLGSFFGHVAADIASVVPHGARVLEIGCGPGHLSILLARRHGFDVTGLDLDPVMIERARTNAERPGGGDGPWPSFLVGDVASLALAQGSVDAVVSTLSMHHWTDPVAGLSEIARVLRPGAPALVWDFRKGSGPLHAHLPDPVERAQGSSMRVVSVTPCRWPWRLHFIERIELVGADDAS